MDSHVKVSRPLRLKHHPEKWQVTLRYYDEEGKSLRKRTWRSTGIKINQKSKSIKQTYAEAVVAAQKILAAEQSKKFGEPKRFQEYAREFLNEKEREGSLSLIAGYKSAFASLKRFLKTDQIFMAQITPTKLNQFFSSGHKPSVADSHYRHLNSFFNQAAILGYITENPLAQVDHKPIRKRYKQNMRPRGVLTVRQVELIYEAMPKETFRDITFANFWLFLFGTALRRSEACFLQERNISLTEKQIRIEKTIDYDLKTDSSAGIIPILHHAERAILNQRENKRTSNNLRVQNSPYLFCNLKGEAYRPGEFTHQVIRRAKHACGILDINATGLDLHSLRHSLCQYLINEGIDAVKVQMMARHANLMTTLTFYVRATDTKVVFAPIVNLMEKSTEIKVHNLFQENKSVEEFVKAAKSVVSENGVNLWN